MKFKALVLAASAAAAMTASAHAATLVASYSFNGNLNSSVAGAPALTLTDPTATSGYVTDTVNGSSRTVLSIGGAASPTSDQGGLTFNSTGLLTSDSYSVALTFEFLGGTDAWRRIVDVEGRLSDNGFYVDPDNKLDVFPVAGSGVPFTTAEYHTVVLTVGTGGDVHAYIDGLVGALSTTTTEMDISGTGEINLFLDNVVAGGQGEWSPSHIAQADFYDGVLSQGEIGTITGGVPEPASWALMLVGFGGLGAMLRRRRTSAVALA